MKSRSLTGEICKSYCQYYKPSKEEDIACMGFVVAGRLVEEGILAALTPVPGPHGEEDETGLPCEDTSEKLRNQMCPVCPFYENDCDFISFHRHNTPDARQVNAMPCGGFLFLGRLIDRKIIDIRDVNQVI
jgi:hypothetical protein